MFFFAQLTRVTLSPTRWLGWQGGSAPCIFPSAVWVTELRGEDFLWDGVSGKATQNTCTQHRDNKQNKHILRALDSKYIHEITN